MMKTNALKDHFQGTRAKRQFFASEELVAYDVNQLMEFEEDFAKCGLSHSPDGLPPMAVLLAAWKKARDSFERVAEALPHGELRDQMLDELAKREAVMDGLAQRASEILKKAAGDA
jgi:hypothetical protein